MGWSLRRLFRKKADSDSLNLCLEEMRKVQKLLRRQKLEVERLASILEDRIPDRRDRERGLVMEAAEALFHFSQFLESTSQWSQNKAQALEMIWIRMERLLAVYGLQIIRHKGVPFDPSIHDAVESISETSPGFFIVGRVVQPGFKDGRQVLRPAKVVVAAEKNGESIG